MQADLWRRIGDQPRGTWRKTARTVWSAYFFFSANIVDSVGGFELSRARRFFSLSAVSALHVRTSAVETNRSVVSRSPHICFLVQVGISEQTACFPGYRRRIGRGLVSVGFVDTRGQNPFSFVLNDLF
ncbi:hypothetical protein TNCV_1056511 [Trichonephila clavipes]|nr:hypothetical protein TNCV_1056511 [Trichonephila clavipes]